MRISDWSSDVCSSDEPAVLSRPESLAAIKANAAILVVIQIRDCRRQGTIGRIEGLARQASGDRFDRARPKGRGLACGRRGTPQSLPCNAQRSHKIGNAKCRERECPNV